MSVSKLVVATLALGLGSCASVNPALPTATPEALGLSREGLAQIAPALQAYVDSGKYAGVYAVIARHGQIGYERTFGYNSLAKRKRLRRDDVFRIYSMTKPVVAAGALKLIDQGKLALNDPVAKYIPAFANIRIYAGGTADQPTVVEPDSVMTVRHLLTHTSGLSYGLTTTPADTIFTGAALYQAASTLQQFADSVAKLPLIFSPGTRFSYSSALEIVGRIIEVVSGLPLDVYLEQELFKPLGMSKTTFRHRGDIDKRLAELYMPTDTARLVPVGHDGLQGMYDRSTSFLWASGGLLSTPDDYLRFAQMLLNGGELNSVRVLSTSIVNEMMRNQLPASLTPVRVAPDQGYGYGLGGSVLVDSTLAKLPGATGIYRWSGYVGTYFWIDPKNDLIAMVWTQLSPGRTYPLEQEFQRLVYAALER